MKSMDERRAAIKKQLRGGKRNTLRELSEAIGEERERTRAAVKKMCALGELIQEGDRCMKASAEERLIILQCAISAAPGLEIAIYDSITSGSGYRTLLRMGRQIPAGEDDFYAYRRKTLAEISRYMRLLGRWKE